MTPERSLVPGEYVLVMLVAGERRESIRKVAPACQRCNWPQSACAGCPQLPETPSTRAMIAAGTYRPADAEVDG